MIKNIRNLLNEVYINESSNSLIAVDIQPMYEKYIDFNISDFVEYMKNFNKVLFFYVGAENSGIGTDTREDIIEWLISEYDYPEDMIDNITFIEKGYAFFRGLMDTGYDEDMLIDLIRYMQDNDIWDSRGIEDPEKVEYFQLEDYSDNIFLPDTFDMSDLRGFENSVLVGGGADECLREVKLYLDANNFPYKEDYSFIY